MKKRNELEKDFSKENPGLHMLYVKWACEELTIIDKCIERINNVSRITMVDIICSMQREREKLIKNDKAFKEADEILEIIKKAKNEENEFEDEE